MNIGKWDTLFVADVGIINEALARSTTKLLTSFDVEMKLPDTGVSMIDRLPGLTAHGTFGPWSIVPGGADQIVNLQLPIVSGTCAFPGLGGVKTKDIGGTSVVVSVHLALLPAPQGNSKNLVFSFKGVGKASNGPGVVEPLATRDPSKRLTPEEQGMLKLVVATALVKNAGRLSFVFATINPANTPAASWLNPVHSKYSLADTNDGRMALAIFSVTDARDASGFPCVVEPTLLAPGSKMALALSPHLFMHNVFRPALAKSFGIDANALQTDAAGTITGGFHLPSVTNAGTPYDPVVHSFSASIADTNVTLALNGSCDMRMNIMMHFDASASLAVSLDVSALTLKTTLVTRTFNKDVDVPWYDRILEFLGAGIGAIIFEVSVSVIGDHVGDSIGGSAAAEGNVSASAATVSWAGADGFKSINGGLASCFYIRGVVPSESDRLADYLPAGVTDVAVIQQQPGPDDGGPPFDVQVEGSAVRGTFGPCTIMSGMGERVGLQLSIASGTLTEGAVSADVAGTSVVLVVSLEWRPASSPQPGGHWLQLVPRFDGVSPTGTVEGIAAFGPPNPLTAVQRSVLPHLVASALDRNVSFPLAMINPAGWPGGTQFGYRFDQSPADGRTTLTILSSAAPLSPGHL